MFNPEISLIPTWSVAVGNVSVICHLPMSHLVEDVCQEYPKTMELMDDNKAHTFEELFFKHVVPEVDTPEEPTSPASV